MMARCTLTDTVNVSERLLILPTKTKQTDSDPATLGQHASLWGPEGGTAGNNNVLPEQEKKYSTLLDINIAAAKHEMIAKCGGNCKRVVVGMRHLRPKPLSIKRLQARGIGDDIVECNSHSKRLVD